MRRKKGTKIHRGLLYLTLYRGTFEGNRLKKETVRKDKAGERLTYHLVPQCIQEKRARKLQKPGVTKQDFSQVNCDLPPKVGWENEKSAEIWDGQRKTSIRFVRGSIRGTPKIKRRVKHGYRKSETLLRFANDANNRHRGVRALEENRD